VYIHGELAIYMDYLTKKLYILVELSLNLALILNSKIEEAISAMIHVNYGIYFFA